MNQNLTLIEIKTLFPDEWVLIGNPVMTEDKLNLIVGTPIYHSKSKTEVCRFGRNKADEFDKITLIYTGIFRPSRKITGIFNRIK